MIELPDTNGLTVSRAAMTYVRAGIGIVPMNPRGHKSCGNLIGNAADDTDRWYYHVSTDRALINSWRQRFGSFNRLALATSPGAWGGIVLDVDAPDKFPRNWRSLLGTVPFTQTRPSENVRRGHYWFMLPAGHPPVGNPKHAWGEVRSTGGGIVLAPSPTNGRKIVRSGPLPVIPAELLALIAVVPLASLGEAITRETFCARYHRTDEKLGLKRPGSVGGSSYWISTRVWSVRCAS
jgi:Bifunctional DNA primase/polymerase, N-terminal